MEKTEASVSSQISTLWKQYKKSGSRADFEALFSQLQRYLFAGINKHNAHLSSDEKEDIIGDVNLELVRLINTHGEAKAALTTRLHDILRYKIVDHLREKYKHGFGRSRRDTARYEDVQKIKKSKNNKLSYHAIAIIIHTQEPYKSAKHWQSTKTKQVLTVEKLTFAIMDACARNSPSTALRCSEQLFDDGRYLVERLSNATQKSVEENLECFETRAAINTAIQTLRPSWQKFIYLRLKGYTAEETVEITGNSLNTVNQGLSRGQRELKSLFGGQKDDWHIYEQNAPNAIPEVLVLC